MIADQIRSMTGRELDDLPLGVAELAFDGTILFFNRAELQLTNRSEDETVGRNFFRDIAPCTAIKQHQGRFIHLVGKDGPGSDSFDFSYPVGLGRKRVTITMVKRSADATSIFVVTELAKEMILA